ncbi:transmembrane protein 179B isoform X3 [Ochotona curzoniae]|uniref:transmembrane protein 179B isoform X3 n=1 Tax=Ochotona curzoniae TaxID=130825 RepID=UPI001B350EAC|nr:transmembrane protein 179B isoform X3 [Ochotona curzoniae]
MALHCALRVELALLAAAFLCGAVAAAALTRTQVRGSGRRLRGGGVGPVGLRIALAVSAVAVFLVLVSACVLHFGTHALCSSIVSLNRTASCSEAQKVAWTPPGTALQFYTNLYNAETSSWVNLVLWSAVLLLQVAQCKYRPLPYQSLDTGSPGCSSEADALLRPH